MKPCGLAGSSWPEKEETPFAEIDESLVLHGLHGIKYSGIMQVPLAKYIEKCKCRMQNTLKNVMLWRGVDNSVRLEIG